jgi:hypothetical protein
MLAVLAFVLGACGGGNVFEMEVGMCWDDVDGTEVSDVPIVDCSSPHDNEVFYLFDMADGSFPGEEAVQSAAADGCIAAFPAYVGSEYLDSDLDIYPLYPTEGSWDGGDREIVCSVYDWANNGAPLVGSVRGTGR